MKCIEIAHLRASYGCRTGNPEICGSRAVKVVSIGVRIDEQHQAWLDQNTVEESFRCCSDDSPDGAIWKRRRPFGRIPIMSMNFSGRSGQPRAVQDLLPSCWVLVRQIGIVDSCGSPSCASPLPISSCKARRFAGQHERYRSAVTSTALTAARMASRSSGLKNTCSHPASRAALRAESWRCPVVAN
jgi:hypothetical protein